ncbi:uncharacterized protein LOC121385700 [Gigantopelta aegis]|uniref:uncharacterized protein LOC121385700 n=1 Tax=Gigantopelta aegis TaxID=1735272 RepID=UPI001B887FBD|nr:uncharacterized protein LOC121385700 [Gigantopelta aegis]XP_041372410.1 uncharacterized protein LOC121385700 [Gigantopelta aegis]
MDQCTNKEATKVLLNINIKGVNKEIACSKNVADILLCPATDPAIKETLIQNLLQPTTLPAKMEDDPQSSLHFWKENEEDHLIELRHQRMDDFNKTRNHASLWNDIVKELERIGCKVTSQQASNKYASLKKKWKEIIDLPTGSEARYFRHKAAFDNQFGMKASTRPKYTVDTEETNIGNDKQQSENDNEQTGAKKKKCKPTKRKSQELFDFLTHKHDDFKEDMKNMHSDKMRRMDRLLDLYEREVDASSTK